jgi:hypothetical protein
LLQIIHEYTTTSDDDRAFSVKHTIKDSFWRLDCGKGEEWNFAYMLPQPEAEPTELVVLMSLQMGWVESPLNFLLH